MENAITWIAFRLQRRKDNINFRRMLRNAKHMILFSKKKPRENSTKYLRKDKSTFPETTLFG